MEEAGHIELGQHPMLSFRGHVYGGDDDRGDGRLVSYSGIDQINQDFYCQKREIKTWKGKI